MKTMDSGIKDDVFVDEYTGGLVGPSLGFAATIKDGGHISCVVPPGCCAPSLPSPVCPWPTPRPLERSPLVCG